MVTPNDPARDATPTPPTPPAAEPTGDATPHAPAAELEPPAAETGAEVAARVVRAVRGVDGVRPWCPVPRAARSRWDAAALAVDLTDREVRIRLVATALPLPPRLDQTEAAVRRALAGSRWADTPLHLVVTDLDASALTP